MPLLEKFYDMLTNIYGERIVKAFTTKDGDTLKMNDVATNQKVKKEYDRNEGEGCKECKDKFRNKDFAFFKRNLEFPGWIGSLNFADTTPAKEIMIIGEAPTTLKEQKDQINIAFGLGLYPIESNGGLNFEQLEITYTGDRARFEKIRSNQERNNGMWKYINHLFSKKLDNIKDQIYITDLCKCNDDIFVNGKKNKNEGMWKNCRDNYLIEEIKLINPTLIIFQGWSPYKNIMEYFDEKYSREGIISNPHYGESSFNGTQIPHFVIVHQSKVFGGNKYAHDLVDEYINRLSQFIRNKILKEVPEIHKLLNREVVDNKNTKKKVKVS